MLLRSSIIFATAFSASFLSSMSGGGSGAISIPIWLWLGVPLPTAIATEKVNGSMWTLLAARNYLRGIEVDRRLLLCLSLFGLFGVYLGSLIVINADSAVLRRVLGAVIICLVTYVFFRKSFGVRSANPSCGRFFTALFGIPLGIYEGFFGSGNGIFSSLILCKARGYNLQAALGHYYVVAFLWCFFAAVLYINAGFYDLSLMLPASVGALLGGQCGSSFASKRGARVIRPMIVILGGLLGGKLLLGM